MSVSNNKRPLTLEFVKEYLGSQHDEKFYFDYAKCESEKVKGLQEKNRFLEVELTNLRDEVEKVNSEKSELRKDYDVKLKDARMKHYIMFDKLKLFEDERVSYIERYEESKRSERHTNRMFYDKDRQNYLLKEKVKKLEEKLKVFEEEESNTKRKRNDV